MRSIAAVVWLCAIGCATPGVDRICDGLHEDCEQPVNVSDCREDGYRVEDSARSHGCEDQFDDYLECLADNICAFASHCTAERQALVSCNGPLPSD